MKELVTQFKDNVFSPNTPEDLEIAKKEFKQFQLVKIRAFNIGDKKQRSVTQLGLLHACFKLVSDNTQSERLDTPEKVKFACKVRMHFVDPGIVYYTPKGGMIFQYRSFSFATLDHMEACNVFEKCFEYMATLLGITKEKLIEKAQARMQKH